MKDGSHTVWDLKIGYMLIVVNDKYLEQPDNNLLVEERQRLEAGQTLQVNAVRLCYRTLAVITELNELARQVFF